MKKRRVVLLGATGSIGASAIKVANTIPERMEIVAMTAHRNARRLAEHANRLRPEALCLVDASGLADLREALNYDPEIAVGTEGLEAIASHPGADMVLIAIVGTAGLRPALTAIESGKDLAVASKEILVMAGEAVIGSAEAKGVRVLPVDSEHNAIFQCLEGHPDSDVRRLILTASGGPFRETPSSELRTVTPEQALRHPTWDMGPKITIDSATLFNKGLEMIEARWLFGVEMAKVDVVVHPQSIVHSMVEFVDGSVLAQLSHTDMCFPVQYAVTWPDRVPNTLEPLNFSTLGRLEFEAPRIQDFPALDLARQAGETGGTMPAVMNAANEIAVEAFLKGRISFPRIWESVTDVMGAHEVVAHPALDAIVGADRWAREEASRLIGI